MNLFVSRRYDSCFLKWYSESEFIAVFFLFLLFFCFFLLGYQYSSSTSPAGDSFTLASRSVESFVLWNISHGELKGYQEFVFLLPSSHKNLTLSNIILTTPLIEYLRGTATSDECEPLFAKYKQCLSVSPSPSLPTNLSPPSSPSSPSYPFFLSSPSSPFPSLPYLEGK